jgi:hypothetical protein
VVIAASTFKEFVNNFGALLAAAALVVGAIIYLWGTARRGRQDIVRQDNTDLRASNQEMRTQKAADEATIKEQTESIRHLRDIATQTPAVTKLIEMNNKQQKLINEQHLQVIQGLSALTAELGGLATEFAKLSKAINERSLEPKRKTDNE